LHDAKLFVGKQSEADARAWQISSVMHHLRQSSNQHVIAVQYQELTS
jgi:hypothetical protein